MPRPSNSLVKFDYAGFAVSIREAKEAKCKTMLDLIEETGLSSATLQRLLKGKCRYLESILAIAAVCDLQITNYVTYERYE